MRGMKRLMALLLAAVMLLALAACGKNAGENEEDNTGKKSDPKATPTPEFAYKANYEEIGNIPADISYLYPTLVTPDGFYCLLSVKVGERPLQEGEVLEWEGQLDIYGIQLFRLGTDGVFTKLEGYKQMVLDEEEDSMSAYYGGYSSASGSYANTNSMVARADGGFVALECVYKSWSDAGDDVEVYSDEWWEGYQSEQQYYIRTMAADGSELSCVQLDLQPLKDAMDAAGVNAYYDGYSSYGGTEVYLYNLGASGDKALVSGDGGLYIFDVNTGAYCGALEEIDWAQNILTLRDGRVAVCYWADSGQTISAVDLDKGKLGESYKVNGELYNAFSGGGDYDLYYSNGLNFFGYRLSTGESEKLFNWINCDVDNQELSAITVTEDGRVVALSQEWDSNYTRATTSLVSLERVPYSSLPQKQTLTLATQNLDYEARKQIIRFNRAHDDLRIELRDYSEYNTEEDYEAGLTKLRTEILAGNCPDIIDLSGLPAKQMAAKGLLADLYPLLDADPELSREDFFPAVLKAMESNGMLCSTCSGFEIITAVGASRIVGNTPGWTYAELMDALREMPEDCTVFSTTETRADILQICLTLDMDLFVDWNTGEVRFNSQDFIDLLNFVKSFPADFDWDNYEWSEEDDEYVRVRSGRQLLIYSGIYSFDSLCQYESIFGGIDAMTFIGFPTSSGVGSMLYTGTGYGISERCENKEAAWEFVRTFMTEDFQDEKVWEFPSNIHSYETRKLNAMTPTYVKDEYGRIRLDPETGERLMEAKGGYWDQEKDEYVPIYFYTQEEIDKLEELINSTSRVYAVDDSISSIVREQVEAFFSGQRSAEDVANLIQSKARIYVNEQR